jgi:hypothetical protein
MSETDVYRKLPPEKIVRLLHDEANKSMNLYLVALKTGVVSLSDRLVIKTAEYDRLKKVYLEICVESLDSADKDDDKEM